MSDFKLPELPSDEELGIAGMTEDDVDDAPPPPPRKAPPGTDKPPPGSPPPVAPPPAARSRWRGPVTLLVLLVMAWLMGSGRRVPGPAAVNAPDTTFSAGRAMAALVELARAPHPIGSPEHARVRESVVERLTDLGLEPEVQTTTSMVRTGERVRAATVRNVLARVPGTASTGAILVTAHYDAVPLSHGAGDDGTGVVTILETLRALRAGPALRNDLIVLITDAEELGLLGARAFVREHAWMDEVAMVLSVEMRGGAGPSIMFETGADNGWVVAALDAGVPDAFANSLSVAIYRRLPNDTDFTPFRDAGVQGLNFAAIGRPRIYHQPTDRPENVEAGTIQHHGHHLLGAIRELGQRDLSSVDAPDRVYFSLPVLGLVTYPAGWALAVSAGLVLLFALVYAAARRRGVRARHLLVGLILSLLAIGASASAAWGLFGWLPRFHPEFGSLEPSFHEEGWYVLAVVGFAFAVVATLFGYARRRVSLVGLALGAILVPLVAAIALEFAVPLGAMNLQWPVAAALLSAGVVAAGSPDRRLGTVRWLLTLVAAVPVLALLVPVTELVWVAMGLSLAAPLGALIALTFLLLVPALEGLGEPNRWWAPLAALAFAGACLGVGILRAGTSPERPSPSTLVYAAEHGSGTALWASAPDAGQEWVSGRVGALDVTDSLPTFGLRGTWLTGAAPVLDTPAPTITLRADSVVYGQRRLTAELSLPLGAEAVTVGLAEGAAGSIVAVNGVPVPDARPAGPSGPPVTSVQHWGRPDGALVLTIDLPPGAPRPALVVVEEHLRPAELLGQEPFARTPGLVPNASRRSDRALLRTRLESEGWTPARPMRSDSGPPPPAPDTAGTRLRPDTTAPAADTTAPAPLTDTTATTDTTGVISPADTLVIPPPDTTSSGPPHP
jgi:hypothetical protein